jgi:plasmid stabilization system protein ParE
VADVFSLRITKRAYRQIRRAQTWWLGHRDKAPTAFEEDLQEAYAFLTSSPHANPAWKRKTGFVIRRHFLERVRYYLYYRIEKSEIAILAVWHASRRPPRL